jgi:hypothetical protein
MMSLEEYYLTRADECRQANDSFGASYWMQRAFEASSLGE